jgi:hypothetical protein
VGTVIARVHSDGERSFVGGQLREHLETTNVWPTTTEGYDHNANATAESVIKQLSRAVRASLLDCTGGRDRYQEVWGDLYEHAADVYNNIEHADGSVPMRVAGATPVDVDSEQFHVFGAKVLKYIAPERRDGKLDMPTRMTYLAGRSDTIANGHKVVDVE